MLSNNSEFGRNGIIVATYYIYIKIIILVCGTLNQAVSNEYSQ